MRADGAGAVLLETGRVHRVEERAGGTHVRTERRLRTPDGGLRLAERPGDGAREGSVRVVREHGPVGHPVRVWARDLPALTDALACWMAERQAWWAFEVASGGAYGGYAGGRLTVQAPGAGAPEVRIGRRRMGVMVEGRDFTGVPEERTLTAPGLLPAAAGALRAGELVWVGERVVLVDGVPDLPVAPPDVARVGAVYTAGACTVRATRTEAVLHAADGGSLYLFPHEAGVFAALLALPPLTA
jgi:hypothetical protein